MGIFDFFSNKFKKGNKQVEPSSFGVDPNQNLPEPTAPQSTNQDDSLLTENNKAWEQPKNEEPTGSFSFVPQGQNIVAPTPTPTSTPTQETIAAEPEIAETPGESQASFSAEPLIEEISAPVFAQAPVMQDIDATPFSDNRPSEPNDNNLTDGTEVNLSQDSAEALETPEIQENMPTSEPFGENVVEDQSSLSSVSPEQDIPAETKADDQMPHYNTDVINYDEEETYQETPETPPTPEGEYAEDYSGQGNMSDDFKKDNDQVDNIED